MGGGQQGNNGNNDGQKPPVATDRQTVKWIGGDRMVITSGHWAVTIMARARIENGTGTVTAARDRRKQGGVRAIRCAVARSSKVTQLFAAWQRLAT